MLSQQAKFACNAGYRSVCCYTDLALSARFNSPSDGNAHMDA